MRTLRVQKSAVVILTGLALLGTGVATANATKPTPEHKVWVCHATSSDSNPYQIINIDEAAAEEGHLQHKLAPNKTWKDAGTFGGVSHTEGQDKPDIIGAVDAQDAPAECLDSTPTETTSTTTTPTETTSTTTTPTETTSTTAAVIVAPTRGVAPTRSVAPVVVLPGQAQAANPLPTAADAGQANTSGLPILGGFAAFAGLLMLGAGIKMHRRHGAT